MNFKMLKSGLAGLILSVSSMANAGLIFIDQAQSLNTTFMAGFAQGDLAQSFQQSNNNIAGAGIFLRQSIGISDTVTISLWDALPNQSGNLLASASGVGNSGSWFDVFWNPVSIPTNTTLFLVFTSTNSTLGIAGSTSNPYNRGQVFANSGYSGFAAFDYTFRTYASDTVSIPEPSTLAIFALGIMGLAARRFKKQ